MGAPQKWERRMLERPAKVKWTHRRLGISSYMAGGCTAPPYMTWASPMASSTWPRVMAGTGLGMRSNIAMRGSAKCF